MTYLVRPSGDGGWLAFVSGPRLLVTPAGADSFVDAAWAAISSADGFRLSLDLLASNGFAATPPFVLVERSDTANTRIIIRGESTLTVTDAAGSQPLSASGVSTWVERSISGVAGIEFTVPDSKPVGSLSLPFESGVSLVAGIALGLAGSMPSEAEPSEHAPSEAAPQRADNVVAPSVSTDSNAAAPDQVTAAVKSAGAPNPAPEPVPEVDVEATVREAPEAISLPPEPTVAPPDVTDVAGYDYLFGDTMYRSVADAVVHEPVAVDPDDEPVVDDALHDGETVLTSDIAKIRGKRRPRDTPAAPEVAVAQNMVLAVSTTGARESMSQPILIGRSPSVSKVSGGQIPRLLTVGTPDQDISRNHVQVALEGGTVVVTDLHSRNGTMVELPGKSPQKLRAGEPTSVILGTVIDLGSGVTLTVEEADA